MQAAFREGKEGVEDEKSRNRDQDRQDGGQEKARSRPRAAWA
jgi:hypothetical protein